MTGDEYELIEMIMKVLGNCRKYFSEENTSGEENKSVKIRLMKIRISKIVVSIICLFYVSIRCPRTHVDGPEHQGTSPSLLW